MDIIQEISGFFTPYAFETITVDGTVKQLTATKLKPYSTQAQRDMGHARLVLITVETHDVRYTLDGTDPVSGTTGHIIPAGGALSFANFQALLNYKFTREGGSSATFQVTYLR